MISTAGWVKFWIFSAWTGSQQSLKVRKMCLQRHSFTLGQLEEYFREEACTQLHARVFTSRFLHCFPLRNVFPPTIFIQFVLHTSHRNIHIWFLVFDIWSRLSLLHCPPFDSFASRYETLTSLCSYPCFRSILYHLPVLCSVLGPCTVTCVPLFVFPFAVHLHGGSCCFVTSVSPVMSFTTHDTSTPSLCLASMYARRPLTFYRSHVLS